MTEIQLANWLALYAATALCSAIAAALSLAVAAARLTRERPWKDVRSFGAAVLLLPRSWWRWQKLYLLSTPVTLAIVISFALTLHWS